jgi:LCP family protein required for cell wall assembly
MAADDTSPIASSTSTPVVMPPLRRTWPQRLTIVGVFLAALGCFGAGSGLYAAQRIVEDRNIVVINRDGESAGDSNTIVSAAPAAGDPNDPTAAADVEPAAPVETFPPAEPAARNFLITGADNNSCVDPTSPYYGAFGDRSGFGERSDTIMMWRVNPATSQVAVLSFPRDLWLRIADRSRDGRINEAYERDQPQRLIDTIEQNFGIRTDHFVQVDFCAFKTLVDAVNGVAVPFERPVRDVKTGLFVPTAGCFTFDGDHALAYVRSRSIQEQLDDGTWSRSDGTSDLGRISRQQDFIRRTVDSLLAAGAFDPSVIRALIETSDSYVVNDVDLTLNKMLEFAGVLKNIDPALITTYQIEARGTIIQGNSVLIPTVNGDNMQAILKVFRGEATLAGAPEQVFAVEPDATSTTLAADTPSTTPDGSVPVGTEAPAPSTTVGESPTTTIEDLPFATLPEVVAENQSYGVVPDPNVRCT